MKTEELRAERDALQAKLDAIERKEKRERAKALMGKCFKYRNCYSCPKTDKDYWWMYARVVGVDQWGGVRIQTFQIDSEGAARMEVDRPHPASMFGGDGGYKPITLPEFRAGVRRFYSKVADVADKVMA